MLLVSGNLCAQGCPVVLICWAVQQHMVYRLYTVWLSASWAYAVLCVMAWQIPKTAVVLTQHGSARA